MNRKELVKSDTSEMIIARAQTLRQFALIAVTFLSKAIGFAREFLLLGAVGISRDLDNFFIFFGISSLFIIFLSSTIYTNVTPYFSQAVRDGEDGQEMISKLVSDSFLLGFLTAMACAAVNLAVFAAMSAFEEELGNEVLILALLPCFALLFNVVAEYISSILTAQQKTTPIIFGNMFISLPTIVFMLLFDTTVLNYTIVFAFSYALRATFLFYFANNKIGQLKFGYKFQLPGAVFGVPMENLIAGSGMIAIQLCFMLALFVSRLLPEGDATLYAYSIKFPHLYISTVWLVLGISFFSTIVNSKSGAPPIELMIRLTALNLAAMIAFLSIIGGFLQLSDQVQDHHLVSKYALIDIAWLILFIMPVVAFIPIIDMGQKVLATENLKGRVLRISAAILGVFVCLSPIVLFTQKLEHLLVGLTIAFAAGAIATISACWDLRGPRDLPSQRT